MRQRTEGKAETAGRHRLPWGRSRRILPIRWGRIVAAVAAAAALAVSLALVHNSSPRQSPSASEPAVAATSMVTSQPDRPAPTDPGPDPAAAPTAAPTAGTDALAGPAGEAVVPTDAGAPAPGDAPSPGPPSPAPGVGGSAPPETEQVGPAIGLSSTSVAFGAVESTVSVDLLGVGTAPAHVRVGGTPAWVRVVPRQDVVDPGARVPLVVTLDRETAPPGTVDLSVPVRAVDGSGGGSLRITATVSGAPSLSVAAAPAEILVATCAAGQGPNQATVTATVVDPTGVLGVEVRTRAPDGTETTAPLALVTAIEDRSTWSGPIGPAPAPGTLAYTVVATDLDGRKSEAGGSVEVRPCPTG
ncbi:hypothetical protein CC117_20340 [Parafrankia colletiae]|uniref:Uncharacterized protein n=1 Tax=Parafrankia colletiae TaxID=573497 RepID=A0A1S1QNW6_9ACTN|nr:hypothetical protein [Parafrankia colletiae]MCK9903937.1 hypothetical protein [Frankia sp. Cpl3]OHV35121.1 hypothetical protein CC117_20340 [Parafrankia colletiae]